MKNLSAVLSYWSPVDYSSENMAVADDQRRERVIRLSENADNEAIGSGSGSGAGSMSNERYRIRKKGAEKISTSFYVGDGGGLQVDNLASLLQRRLKSIILFCSSSVTLKPSTEWNPATDKLSENHIDFDIPSFFGVIPEDYTLNGNEVRPQ